MGVPLVSALTPRPFLRPEIELQAAMLQAGGEWVVEPTADPAEVVREARERGVRALSVIGPDIGFVRELPDLEFLRVGDCRDVSPALDLPALRSFSAVSWRGEIDGAAWPGLTWFGTAEVPKDGKGMGSVLGHPAVRSLWLGRFRDRDLTSITAPSLVELHLGPAPQLESLSGLQQHADRLEVLDLHSVPALTSLRGLGSLVRLEVLGVGAARQVSTLEDVAAATSLRLLKVDELKGVESLAPLAGHPRLEFLTLGQVTDRDLGPLFELPRLALVAGPPRGWNRDIHDLPYAHDIPDDDPRQVEYTRLVLRL
jgi:hypothetical protein